MLEVTDITNQMQLTDIYLQNISPKPKEYTFLLAPHGDFSKTDHILGTNLISINISKLKWPSAFNLMTTDSSWILTIAEAAERL